MKKFEQLADELARQIREGVFAPGEKIHSVRQMSQERGLSINTVLKAYELLERKGLLITKPQSGFYVLGRQEDKRVQVSTGTTLPMDIQIPDLLGILINASKDTDFVQFGAAYLAPALYPTAHINQLTRQVLREYPETASSYELLPGSFDYRRQVSRHFAKIGCDVPPEEILATNGGAEAVSLALRAVCRPGDTVITESPLFFGTLQAMEGHGLRIIEIRSHPTFGMDLDQLQQVLRQHRVAAAVVMPNFSNPLGSAMSDTDKKALLAIMGRYGIPVIEDDIYAELPFQGGRPKPLKAFDRSGTVITCSSFSKTISPGLRIGWIAAGQYYEAVRKLQLSTTMAAGTLSQKIMAQYMASRHYDRNMQKIRLFCSIHVNRVAQEVLSHFPSGTRVGHPQGGFVLWVELPKRIDSVALYEQAIANKVTFSPGVLFSATTQYRHFLRLNCGNVWSPRVEAALKTLGALAHRL